MINFAGGMHGFLDRFEDQLDGVPLVDWGTRINEVRAIYPRWGTWRARRRTCIATKPEVSLPHPTSSERDEPMSRLAATLFVSLDGVVESPEKWSFPYWNDAIGKFKREETFASDALLLGRVTYEGFASAWPGRKDPDGFADRFNSMPKYVASRTLKKLEWNNSHLIDGDLVPAVSKLKRQPGQDIVIHGSPTLIRSLMPHDLIDEYRLLVYPIVLGPGKRLFDETSGSNLKLVEAEPYDTGVVKLVYHRADKPSKVPRGRPAKPK